MSITLSRVKMRLHIYTDGACKGNPGKGGWGALAWEVDEHELQKQEEPFLQWSGSENMTTNNKMELMAVIVALEELRASHADIIEKITVFTDSVYVFKGITEWLMGWIAKGWRTTTGPVKNEDLWRRLHSITKEWTDRKVEWRWVKGHSSNKGNQLADALACSMCT